MRKLILGAIAASTAFAAGPAAAQVWVFRPAVRSQIQSDINQLDRQIERAASRGTISRREATGLRRQANNVQRLHNRYGRNGFTRQEVAQLESEVNQIRQRLRLERRDFDGRRG
jgi:outer membrane murein-binding lipoprotein Lpp